MEPSLVQTNTANGLAVATLQNVTAGNMISVIAQYYGGSATPTCADTRGTVYTRDLVKSNSLSDAYLVFFSGIAPTSGTCTVTVTSGGASYDQVSVSEYHGSTNTVNASISANGNGGTPASGNLVTTVNGCLCISAVGGYRNSGFFIPIPPIRALGMRSGSDCIGVGYIVSGVAGTYTDGFLMVVNDYWEAAFVAYEPSDSLSITNSGLPDGSTAGAYSGKLKAHSGTGAYAWTVSAGSLPDSLSLDGSTGIISGTPTATGSFTFTIQVEDDDSNTATKAFTVNISDTLQSVAIVQSATQLSSADFFIDLPGNVTAGNILLAFVTTANLPEFPNGISDSLGTVYESLMISGHLASSDLTQGYFTHVFIGVAPSTGPNTVTFVDPPVGCGAAVIEISGAQRYLQDSTFKVGTTFPDPVTSSTIATTGASDLLFAIAVAQHSDSEFEPDAPFTEITFYGASGLNASGSSYYLPVGAGNNSVSYSPIANCDYYHLFLMSFVRGIGSIPGAVGSPWYQYAQQMR